MYPTLPPTLLLSSAFFWNSQLLRGDRIGVAVSRKACNDVSYTLVDRFILAVELFASSSEYRIKNSTFL